MSINIENYATTIIDNNDDVAEKTITLFKEVGQGWNGNFQHMCGILRINNVRNGFIAYDFQDYKLNYELAETTFTTGDLPSGLDIKIYKDGEVIKSESVMISNNFQQILGNSVIYTFNYEYAIDIEINFMFGYGLRKYKIGTTPSECHCTCSKCSGGDPIYNTSSLYDYIDIKVTYNQSGLGEDLFTRVAADFNEFEEVPGTHSYKREYDLGEIDFRMVDVGINENKALEFAFFDTKWNPNDPEILEEQDETYKDGPCSRYRAIGTVLREEIQHFRDHTEGELPEVPYENVVTTKENLKNSDIFKRVSFDSGTSQLCTLNTYEIIDVYEQGKNANAIFKVYLTKEEKIVKLIVEYVIQLPNVNGIENDRVRFKSKVDIGLDFKLK